MTQRGFKVVSRVMLPAFAVAALASTLAKTARAQQPSPSDSSQPTTRSFWGPFPTDTDSTRVRFVDPGMPLWESMLVWPYRVISFPVRVVGLGIGESIEWLDESRTLQRIGSWLGPRRGPFGVVLELSAGGLPGFGAGATLEHDALFGPANRFRLRASWTLRDNGRLTSGILVPVGGGTEIEFGAGLRHRSNARFFGLGPDAVAADRSFYRQDLTWLAGSLHRRLGTNLGIGSDVVLSNVSTGAPRDPDEPALADRFAGRVPTGYDRRSTGVSVGLFVSHDDTDGDGRPRTGGIRRLRATYFRGVGSEDARFWSYRAELQQFVPLWYRSNVLALRGYVTWIDPIGGTAVPFQRLMTNDDPDLLRGFRDFRWRDRGLIALSVEYRWPLWVYSHVDRTGVDMYVLADVGQVFGTFSEISEDRLTTSYGVGLRLLSRAGFVLRLEYARSGEESVWRLRSDQIFQFAKGRLYHGRDPVPRR